MIFCLVLKLEILVIELYDTLKDFGLGTKTSSCCKYPLKLLGFNKAKKPCF